MKSRVELLAELASRRAANEPLKFAACSLSGAGVAVPDASFLVAQHIDAMNCVGVLSGLFPFADANAEVLKLVRQVNPTSQSLPVIASVCGTHPFRLMEKFLSELQSLGIVAVQNWPTVGLMDGTFRRHLEEGNIGYAREVEAIRQARELGLLTFAFVFDAAQSLQMMQAGADVLLLHPGPKAFRKEFSSDSFATFARQVQRRCFTEHPGAVIFRYEQPALFLPV